MGTLITTIKESGLMLVTYGNANTNPLNVKLQEKCGVDAIICDGIFRHKSDI